MSSRSSRRTSRANSAVASPASAASPNLSQSSQNDGIPVSTPIVQSGLPSPSVSHSNLVTPRTPSTPYGSTLSSPAVPRTPLEFLRSPQRSELGSVGRRHYNRAPPRTPSMISEGGEEKKIDSMEVEAGSGSQLFPQQPEEVVIAELWGTTVNVEKTKEAFRLFFDTFKEEGTSDALYPRLLRESLESGVYHININCNYLYQADPSLYKQLVTYPQEVIPIMDLLVEKRRREIDDAELASDDRRIQVRPFSLKSSKGMRELNPEEIDTLISIKGMVIRCGGILPEMKNAFFQCQYCDYSLIVLIEDGQISEPSQCASCNTKNSMQLIHNRCAFSDKQLIRIQETPDSIPEGDTPHTVNVFAYDELVDVCRPGDRVEITGIYRAHPVRINPKMRTLKTVYKTYVDAIHFKKTDGKRLAGEDAKAEKGSEFYTKWEESDNTSIAMEERLNKIKELSRDPNIYERLTRSLAPSIWEMDDVKKGLLCLLFGGSNLDSGAAHGRFRGEINVLLCGDPGTSKSQLLQYVHKIAPRGIYTSGKGSSAVGLTASIVRDIESRELVLESGALVLSDRGVCCIDEFDKMSDATRSILHEVMEQQTVSIAKAGIVCTLNARTSILASANPKESRYNPKLSVVQNIQLPPTLLSRFDLIYLVLDQPNDLRDRKLAKHLVSLYMTDHDREAAQSDRTNNVSQLIDKNLLTAYITYARKTCKPRLTSEAEDLLIHSYTEMRNTGRHSGAKCVTATPRQLEALIRLSEALAKMRLREEVSRSDVEEAVRLMKVATQTAATDPTTGRIDMDLLTTGHSSVERERENNRKEVLRQLFEDTSSLNRNALETQFNETLKALNQPETNREEFDSILHALIQEGYLQQKRGMYVRVRNA